MGVRGRTGDFNDSEGREFCTADMLNESLGLAATRAAEYMMAAGVEVLEGIIFRASFNEMVLY